MKATKSLLPGQVKVTRNTPAQGARAARGDASEEKAPTSDRPSFVSLPRDEPPEPESPGSEP